MDLYLVDLEVRGLNINYGRGGYKMVWDKLSLNLQNKRRGGGRNKLLKGGTKGFG